jgi:hypothetical protein
MRASRLSPREVEVCRILADGRDLIEAVRGFRRGEPVIQGNRYSEAIKALQNLSEGEGIPIVMIGEMATIYHGYESVTMDLDVVVSAQDFDQIIKPCLKYGFEIRGYNSGGIHKLLYKGLEIKVIKEGMFASGSDDLKAMPGPADLDVGHGLQCISLPQWVRLKLSGGRIKDRADIVEVIKRKNPEDHEKVETYLRGFNPGYAVKIRQLAKNAEREKQQESLFGGGSQ